MILINTVPCHKNVVPRQTARASCLYPRVKTDISSPVKNRKYWSDRQEYVWKHEFRKEKWRTFHTKRNITRITRI